MRRSALVTGASRGIGRGIARALAEKGWPVCVNYLEHRDAAESLAEELRKAGRNAIIYQADVSDRKAVEAMVRAASASRQSPRPTMRRTHSSIGAWTKMLTRFGRSRST